MLTNRLVQFMKIAKVIVHAGADSPVVSTASLILSLGVVFRTPMHLCQLYTVLSQ